MQGGGSTLCDSSSLNLLLVLSQTQDVYFCNFDNTVGRDKFSTVLLISKLLLVYFLTVLKYKVEQYMLMPNK